MNHDMPTVEKGIPMPAPTSLHQQLTAMFKTMVPGDSFVTGRSSSSISNAAEAAGVLITTRQCEGGMRVWLVSKDRPEDAPRQARPGEITMKEWRIREAKRLGLAPSSVAMRYSRGKDIGLPIRRVNKRVVFVFVGEDNSLECERKI